MSLSNSPRVEFLAPRSTPPPGILTYSEKEAARLLNLSRPTLLKLRQKGKIAHYREGSRVLYSPAHLTAYLKSIERAAVQGAATPTPSPHLATQAET